MAERTFPDRFRSEVLSLARLAAVRWRVLAGALVAAVALTAGLGVWWWHASRREGEAGRALAEANQVFRRQYPSGFYLPGGEPGDPKPDSLIEQYLKLADTFAGTQAAAEARLRAAHLQYSAGQYDAALRNYDQYATTARGPFRAAALLGKAYCLLAKGDKAAAIEAFGTAAEAAPREALAAEAYLAQGRSLEALQKREEALRAYALVAEKFPETAWAIQARERTVALR